MSFFFLVAVGIGILMRLELISPGETIVSARQDLDVILAAVDELPPKCREVFLMQRNEGLAYAEIASRLGISESMVQKHMSKALTRLHDAFSDCVNVPPE